MELKRSTEKKTFLFLKCQLFVLSPPSAISTSFPCWSGVEGRGEGGGGKGERKNRSLSCSADDTLFFLLWKRYWVLAHLELLLLLPNQQRTRNKLLTEFRSRNYVSEHRLRILIGAKHAKTLMQRAYFPTEPAFCIHVGGWEKNPFFFFRHCLFLISFLLR